MFPAGDIDLQIPRPTVLANNHAGIDLCSGADKEGSPFFCSLQCVGCCGTGFPGNQAACLPLSNGSRPRSEMGEGMVHDAMPPGLSEELRGKADQPPGRHEKLSSHPPFSPLIKGLQLALSLTDQFHN